jgi:hypothetical protein
MLVKKMSLDLSNAAYDHSRLPIGYKKDDQLSDRHTLVSTDREGNPYIAFRGTSDLGDVAPDVDIALGLRQHPRFAAAVNKTKSVEAKYGKRAKLTGHSLGGTLAEHVSDTLGNSAEVYNPGKSLFGSLRNSNSRITYNRKASDPISGGIRKATVWENLADTLIYHPLRSFK